MEKYRVKKDTKQYVGLYRRTLSWIPGTVGALRPTVTVSLGIPTPYRVLDLGSEWISLLNMKVDL